MVRSESSWQHVAREASGLEVCQGVTSELGVRSTASKIVGALEQGMVFLALLVYSIFLAEILFHVLLSFSIPFAVLREHVLPALLLFLDSLGPAAEALYNDVLAAVLLFLSALLLPLTASCCLHFFLFPSYLKLVKLVW